MKHLLEDLVSYLRESATTQALLLFLVFIIVMEVVIRL